jgi:hypothetical protein
METPPPPSRKRTIEGFLSASKRPTETVPIRFSFVQMRTKGGEIIPGPLAELVRRGRDSTLEQYLLLHALASSSDLDFGVKAQARVWARALGLSDDEAGRRTVGRNWRILNDLRLVHTERAGREIRAIKLREDGSSEPYRHPGEAPRERYMQLPFRYWLDDYFLSLDVPAKAVLMIAMTQGDWFSLPTRRGPEWYGLGRSTLERGFKNAGAVKVIERRAEFKDAPLAPEGYTRENFYRLLPPFGPRGVLAKSAHPIFSIEAAKLSPPPQTDKPKRRTKRRKPAAKTSQKEKTEATGAQREPRPRQPVRSV